MIPTQALPPLFHYSTIRLTIREILRNSPSPGADAMRMPKITLCLFASMAALAAPAAQAQAQAPAAPAAEVVRPQDVRPLPNGLDSVPVFNSNSPELVLQEGILLSTLSPEGKAQPTAHLDFTFDGRFDIFAHHIAKADPPEDLRSLYLGILIHNPSDQTVTVNLLQGASYLSQPDAPFFDIDPFQDNPDGGVYAGPGSRAMSDVLRGRRQDSLPEQVVIPAGESRMLMNLPIPVKTLDPPINGRSSLLRLRSDGPVQLASMALFARPSGDNPDGPEGKAEAEIAPSLEDWQALALAGQIAGPRDRTPTPIGEPGNVIYGRVAGVAEGSRWRATLSDRPDFHLNIPAPGGAFSYGLATLNAGRQGTGQNQSARMLRRYPDTAYQAHGNYGIEYDLSLPLINPTDEVQRVTLALETPIKEDVLAQDGLRFFVERAKPTFFRGTVRVRYVDDQRRPRTRYVHLVQKRGEQGKPLVELNLQPGEHRLLRFDFLYPPDATPPQVLTVQTH
jgi:hypothetical protein